MKISWWLWILPSLVACQTSRSRQHWDQSAAAGKPISRDVALLHTVALVDPDPSIGQFCTGVIIDKRHILTAARCFLDEQRIPFAFMEKDYAPNLEFADRGSLLRVELVAVNARYQKARADQFDEQVLASKDALAVPSPGAPMNDLAIALLENDVIAPYRPVRVVNGNEDLRAGRIVNAGYGCKGSACEENEGELRKVEMQFVKTLPDAQLVVLNGGKGRGTCAGDLGGPAYRVDPQGFALLAITTAGIESCEAGITPDTLVAPNKAWIDQAMKVLARPMLAVDGIRVIDFTQAQP